MDSIEQKLAEFGLTLPPAPSAAGNYLPFRRAGNVYFLSGAISTENGEVVTGRAGTDKTMEDGYAAARLCALNLLAIVKMATGSLESLKQVLTVNGYVNVAPDFTAVPDVINGASDLFVALYGEAGRHARAAVGVASLPKGCLVEVQMSFEANA